MDKMDEMDKRDTTGASFIQTRDFASKRVFLGEREGKGKEGSHIRGGGDLNGSAMQDGDMFNDC